MSTELARRQDSAELVAMIGAAAQSKDVDPAKLGQLLDFKERIEARDAKALYTASMAQMSRVLPRITKDGKIDLGGRGSAIKFATWEHVDAVLRPILAEHGFSLSFPTRVENGQLIMACVVSHVGGHSEQSEAPVMPDAGPGRNQTQAIGSGRSYTKRYLTLDMLNIVTVGQDDHGKAAGFITVEQGDTLRDLISEAALNKEELAAFLKFAEAASVNQIQAADFGRCKEALSAKLRQKRSGK